MSDFQKAAICGLLAGICYLIVPIPLNAFGAGALGIAGMAFLAQAAVGGGSGFWVSDSQRL